MAAEVTYWVVNNLLLDSILAARYHLDSLRNNLVANSDDSLERMAE